MPESHTRSIVSRYLLGFGIFFTLLAIGAFAMPFIITPASGERGAGQVLNFYLLYLTFAFAAFVFTIASYYVQGRMARAGWIILACLFGIPLLWFYAAVAISRWL
jgi:hypothetical protein